MRQTFLGERVVTESVLTPKIIEDAAKKAMELSGTVTEAETAPADELAAARKASKTETFSATAMKTIRRQSKDQLVHQVVQLNNYAENQKAANMILMYKVGALDKEIQKLQTELLNYRPEPAALEPVAEQLGEK